MKNMTSSKWKDRMHIYEEEVRNIFDIKTTLAKMNKKL